MTASWSTQNADSPAGRRGPRRAAVLAAVLVCLLVITLMVASLVKIMVFHHRQTDSELRQLQAFWLAEAGLQLAEHQLALDENYQGSTWEIMLRDDPGPQQAQIAITVQSPANDSDLREVTVQAIWPNDPLHRSLQQRTVTLELPEKGASP